ncbi:hypothetical protein [Rhizobium laguerreae]|nr:hypothetical protein [Rhizobium laguerreae]
MEIEYRCQIRFTSGESVNVQLISTAGKLGIHLNFFNADMSCSTETMP